MYGQNLKLPPDLQNEPSGVVVDPTDFVSVLKGMMENIRGKTSRPTKNAPHNVPKELLTCDYVFLRTDATKTPLQRPYTGPYKILERIYGCTFKIETQNGPVTVSIQRVKPAKIDPVSLSFHLPRKRGRPPKVRQPLGGSSVARRQGAVDDDDLVAGT